MLTEAYKFRLYGRTKGRSKKNIDLEIYKKKLLTYKINEFNCNHTYILDIGTGYGESSIYLSSKHKKKIIIACEKYIDGNYNLIKIIEHKNISNIKIYPGNVNEMLQKKVKHKLFSHVFIFFPDPWHKKKHFKRRLVTNDFLKNIYKFLKSKGEIFIVTDSVSYKESIFETIFKLKDFYSWKNQYEFYLDMKDYYNLEKGR